MSTEDKSLKHQRPDIFAQINHELTAENCADIDLETISYGSNKKLWWNCTKDSQHVWESAIKSRTGQGSGCLFCIGHRVMAGNNDLEFLNPDLARQWHPTKNGDLLPSHVTAASTKKVWWLCDVDSRHEWKTAVKTRHRGRGCPLCSKHLVIKGVNDFVTSHPEWLSEWNHELNGPLHEYDVVPSSLKKVWWNCPKDERHIYLSSFNSKRINHGCTVCAGKVIIQGVNDAATHYPELVEEWHPTKNGALNLTEFSSRSNKPVWWICKTNPLHEWKAKIASRTLGAGCHYCKIWKDEGEFRDLFNEMTDLKFIDAKIPVKWNIRPFTQIDIFNEEERICIEYDGLWSHGGVAGSPHSEKVSLAKDVRKTEALLVAGYTVIRIRESGLSDLPVTSNNFFQLNFSLKEDKRMIVERCIEFYGSVN